MLAYIISIVAAVIAIVIIVKVCDCFGDRND
jgi:hypothetical protein